jgi:hypothetical protein
MSSSTTYEKFMQNLRIIVVDSGVVVVVSFIVSFVVSVVVVGSGVVVGPGVVVVSLFVSFVV